MFTSKRASLSRFPSLVFAVCKRYWELRFWEPPFPGVARHLGEWGGPRDFFVTLTTSRRVPLPLKTSWLCFRHYFPGVLGMCLKHDVESLMMLLAFPHRISHTVTLIAFISAVCRYVLIAFHHHFSHTHSNYVYHRLSLCLFTEQHIPLPSTC